jgi:hypothetical protein
MANWALLLIIVTIIGFALPVLVIMALGRRI